MRNKHTCYNLNAVVLSQNALDPHALHLLLGVQTGRHVIDAHHALARSVQTGENRGWVLLRTQVRGYGGIQNQLAAAEGGQLRQALPRVNTGDGGAAEDPFPPLAPALPALPAPPLLLLPARLHTATTVSGEAR